MTPDPWVLLLLAYDHVLQIVCVAVGLAGMSVSLWLTFDAREDWRAVRWNGAVERLIARAHLRSQVVVLLVQTISTVVALLVWSLPTIPVYMGPDSHYIYFVITLRKVGRLAVSLLLGYASIAQARDRHGAFRALRGQ